MLDGQRRSGAGRQPRGRWWYLAGAEEVEVGACELVVDALEKRVRVGGRLVSVGGPRAVFRGVGEGEGAGVEERVGAQQANRHGDGRAQPAPVAAEGRHVWHHAHQRPRAPAGSGTEVGKHSSL